MDVMMNNMHFHCRMMRKINLKLIFCACFQFRTITRPHASNIPGSNDLATALRRLKLRRENETAERDYAEMHIDSPTCPSPDSFTSGLSGLSGMSTVPAGGGQTFRSYMPEKLQIVKPMEGWYSNVLIPFYPISNMVLMYK